MTTPETAVLRQRVVRVMAGRVGSATDTSAVAAAARHTHDDLTAVLAPLISAAGVAALWSRAFDLAQRQYPAHESKAAGGSDEQAQVTLWLETQAPAAAIEAAVAIFATFAQLLTALIGEPLTMRYLEKAWPDGSSDAQPKRKKV